MEIKCLVNQSHGLAEGPLWDPDQRRLLWVDIEAATLHSVEADGSNHREYAMPGGITSISLTDSGHYICTAEKSFFLLSRSLDVQWRSKPLESGYTENRFNDAR